MKLMGNEGPEPIIPILRDPALCASTWPMSEQQVAELLALVRQMAADIAALKEVALWQDKHGAPVFKVDRA